MYEGRITDDVAREDAEISSEGFPRVLVISNNPFSDVSNNGKTLSSLFRGYPVDSLAQLYFSDEIPSGDFCANYFKVSDRDLLRRLRFLVDSPFVGCGSAREMADQEPSPPTAKRQGPAGQAARLGRELFWLTGLWKSDELHSWLARFRPQVVYFMAGDSVFAYRVAEFVSRRYAAELCVYVTDDYVLPRRTCNPLWWLRRAWVDRVLGLAVRRSNLFVTISAQMRTAYRNRYKRDSIIAVHMPAQGPRGPVPAKLDPDWVGLNLVYAGGLHFNRHVPLAQLGAALREFNAEHAPRVQARLLVYSARQPTPHQLRHLAEAGPVEFRGALDEHGVASVLRNADVLVHVESFDRRSREATRLSVSTKIPEYLSYARPILAVGPDEVASMQYLSGVAACVTDPALLSPVLAELLLKPEARTQWSDLASELFAAERQAAGSVLAAILDGYHQRAGRPGPPHLFNSRRRR